jgi:hypothetical protein
VGRAARAAAAAALAAALAAGCGSDADEPALVDGPTAGPTGTAAAGAGAGYATPAEVIDAMARAGLPCSSPEDVASDELPHARSCILEGEQPEDVVAVTWTTEDERQAFAEVVSDEFSAGVLGDGWGVVTVLDQTAERIAAALGGEPQ